MHTQSTDVSWATVRATLVPACFATASEDVPAAQALDRLEGLGALVAEDARVGGVETRDPTTLEFACEIPELIVYTTPDAVEDLVTQVQTLAPALGLQLEVGSTVHHDDSWRDHWKTFYRSQVFGNGALLLRPSWIDREPGDPACEVVIDPGRAFGTGLHESTRLCLELLAGHLYSEEHTGDALLDIGCGSGILSLAAARLFPTLRTIMALDIDPEAAATTRENAELNGLSERLTAAGGILAEVVEPAASYSLVVANIRPKVLIPDAPRIASHVAADGWLMLSGILTEEAEDVASAYQALTPSLALVARPQLGDWTALLFRRVGS
ncbi:MAG: 50S ribosomal protein L11 methyltransferase [Nannocystaceae bacterium]